MRRAQIKKGGTYLVKIRGMEVKVIVVDDTPRHPMAWKCQSSAYDGLPGKAPTFLLVSKDFIERIPEKRACMACGGTGYPPDMACPYCPGKATQPSKLHSPRADRG